MLITHKDGLNIFNGDPTMIDMSPSGDATAGANSFSLESGKSFTDPATGFKITVVSVSSAGAVVDVVPGVTDNQLPSLNFTSPATSCSSPYAEVPVNGMVTLQSNATDDQGISRVIYNYNIGISTVAPYTINWDSTKHPNGWFNIYSEASDLVGNKNITQCIISLNINNAPDTIAPTAYFATPKNGGVYNGVRLPLTGVVSDNNGLMNRTVEFWKDNDTVPFYTMPVGQGYPASIPVQVTGNTISTGQHTIWMKVWDFSGNVGESEHVTFTQNTPVSGSFGVAPNASITSPTNNSTVSGTVNISTVVNPVEYWANVAASSLRFSLDSTTLSTDTTSPFSFSWNSTTVANGPHTLTAYACDTYGNCAPSKITVTVDNTGVTPPPVPPPLPPPPPSDTSAPSIPSNLSASPISTSQINLSWSPSTDNTAVAGYRIYRNGSQLTTTLNTTYSNTGLSPATTYSYTVSAYDAAGNTSSQSTQVSATTQSVVTPPPPAPVPPPVPPVPPTNKFNLGDRVHTTSKLKVRGTPTSTGKAACTQPVNALGTIVDGPTTAAGYTWWNVNYDSSCDGWSVEGWLVR